MSDRPTSILTESQRKYLRDEKEPAYERTMRTRIRERIRAGLQDLVLLTEKMDDEDIEQTINSKNVQQKARRKDADGPPMWALPAFLYRATPEREGQSNSVFSNEAGASSADRRSLRISLTEQAIESGIEEAILRREDVVADVESSISISRERTVLELDDPDVSELALLPREQLDRLARAGEIDSEVYGEAVIERWDRTEDGDLDEMEFRD